MKTILICAVLLLLSGCASMKGVTATDDERKACASHGCTVWTERELRGLVTQAMQAGYEACHASGQPSGWESSAKLTGGL